MKKIFYLTSVFCVMLLMVTLSGCEQSIDTQLVDGGIWCDAYTYDPQLVFFEDGTGKDHGNQFHWDITEDNRLHISMGDWSETYSVSFVKGESEAKVGVDKYLYLIDSNGDEIALESGMMTLQEDMSPWRQ